MYKERLRNIQKNHDLTQAELGQVLNKSQQGYSHIEARQAELEIDNLAFYNLSADYLTGLTNKKQPLKQTAPSTVCEGAVCFRCTHRS